jgi:hypothetical protein
MNVDKAFDRLTAWTLRNCFDVPADAQLVLVSLSELQAGNSGRLQNLLSGDGAAAEIETPPCESHIKEFTALTLFSPGNVISTFLEDNTSQTYQEVRKKSQSGSRIYEQVWSR